MSRGWSFGGGQSSLGYLFKSDDPQCIPPKPSKISEPPSNDETMAKGTIKTATAPCPSEKTSNISNNYHRAQGQNSGNIIPGRPSTKVQSVPGGSSSLGYLFGDDQ